MLVGISYMYTYMAKQREAFLVYSVWMGIPIIPYPVKLDRLKTLLTAQAALFLGKRPYIEAYRTPPKKIIIELATKGVTNGYRSVDQATICQRKETELAP